MATELQNMVAELVFGEKRMNFRCPDCKQIIDPTKFRDQASAREYMISGLCQKCQDQIFNSDDD
jgi:predicted RNA-binding Zn-ribbon protein involved in translation (DUF1610 family)